MDLNFRCADKTILVVDDDTLISLVMSKEILECQGYTVVSAKDGTECMHVLEDTHPDLILLDINLPDINGIEVCRKIRTNGKYLDLPIIFVTASNDDDTLDSAFEAGGTDYILKPINRVELLARIKSALSHKILRDRLVEEEKFKSVLEMAGAVCHELNQPLHAISGYSELLLLDMDEKNPKHKAVKTICEQTERMGVITAKLMKITRYKTRSYLNNTSIIDLEESCKN